MPSYCSAFGCNNRGDGTKNISFHSFPLKNDKLLKDWLAKIKRDNFTPKTHTKICSEHFEADCFVFEMFSRRKRLKPDAIPTKFSFITEKSRAKNANQLRDEDYSEDDDYSRNEGDKENDPHTSNKKDASTDTGDDYVNAILDTSATLKKELNLAKAKITQILFRYENIIGDEMLKSVTGFDKSQFDVIFKILCLESSISQDCKLKPVDQFFMFMVYMRTGIAQNFLAHMFQTQQPTVSKICAKVSDIVYIKIKKIPLWPSKRQLQEKMPPAFFKLYPNCRVIIDCTEFKIQHPSDPDTQQATFSYYKNANTLKGMVGITPSGAVSFISDLWGGSISDKQLFLKSGMLKMLEKGDLILADRGFIIQKELGKKGCTLITPHYLANKIQFTRSERTENKCVAHHRVHIERAIGRIKNFKYFEGAIPNCSLNSTNKYFYILAFFINFSTPLFEPK